MRRSILLISAIAALATVGLFQRGLSAQATRTDPLVAGCNNIVLTHPAGTPISAVAQGITGDLRSIFRYDAGQARFLGWAPGVPEFAVDYPAVGQRLEPVFICMATAGQIVQPGEPGATTATATSTSPPAPTATATPAPSVTPTPTPQPVPVSAGCAALNDPRHDGQYRERIIGPLAFNPGEQISFTAGPPIAGAMPRIESVTLTVDGWLQLTPFPGTLTVTFPPNSSGLHIVSWMALYGTATWTVVCVPAGSN